MSDVSVSAILLTDPPTLAMVARVQKARGNVTATRTARELIRERIQQLGLLDEREESGVIVPVRERPLEDSTTLPAAASAKSA